MNILAIADQFIRTSAMKAGLEELEGAGNKIVVREWQHANIEELQRDNLLIEQGGSASVKLPPELFTDIASFDALIVQFTPVPASVIQSANDLKFIAVLRSGVENIDLKEATARNIPVLNTPGRNARAVAEFTLGMMLAETRNIARTHEALRKGQWLKDYPNSESGIPELYRKTIGLVGFGQVARLLAGYLTAFGCQIIVYDPWYRGDVAGIVSVDLDTLLRRSDIVSVHARYSAETHGLIGEAQLALMKSTAILVNTARSGLVDQCALVKALRERRIQGASIDVFDNEPIPTDDGILGLDNITLTPHLAGSTKDAFENSPRLFASNLLAWMKDKKPLPIVNGVAIQSLS